MSGLECCVVRARREMDLVAAGPSLTAASYGFGWTENTTCQAERMVQHGGFEPGYFASIRLLPRERIGVITLSATGNLGQATNFESLMKLFDEAGLLERTRIPASPELVKARETVVRLLETWNPALVEQSFDPQTQRYSFMRHWRANIEWVGKQHGKCRAEGEIVSVTARHGRFRLACERGKIAVTAHLTPGAPPLLQALHFRQELPVSEAEHRAAEKLASAINTGVAPPAELFHEHAPRAELTTRIAREQVIQRDCKLGQVQYNDGHGNAVFELVCGNVRSELSFRLDTESSLVTKAEVHVPQSFDATCVY